MTRRVGTHRTRGTTVNPNPSERTIDMERRLVRLAATLEVAQRNRLLDDSAIGGSTIARSSGRSTLDVDGKIRLEADAAALVA